MCALKALHFHSAFLLCRLANLISSFIHGTHGRLVVFLCLTGSWRSSRERNVLSNKLVASSSGSSVSTWKSSLLRISSINASLSIDRSFLNETRPTLRGGRAVFSLNSSARWSENKMSGADRPQIRLSDSRVITRSSVWPCSWVGSPHVELTSLTPINARNDKQLDHCDHQHGC